VSEIYIFACQRRVPKEWRTPFAPEEVRGHKVRLIRLPCSAKLSAVHMLRLFEKDIDGVLVMTCGENGCKSLEGSRRARMRVREVNNVLEEIGLGSARVMIRQAQGADEASYIEAVDELAARIEQPGPSPAKGNTDR
jgi:coenzyme F420-reducing hydrogenase delta subunit